MPNVKIVCCEILTKTVGVFYKCTGEARVVEPDPLSEGFRRYSECGMEHFVFEFLLNYDRKIKSDKEWRKLLKKNPTKPFLLFVTPSDIAHVLLLIKNGRGVWDQALRMDRDRNSQGEKKALPLFTKGEGQKRESGKSMWSDEGMNFYYTAEKNWKKVYDDLHELEDLCKKWEEWEPKDKYKKNPVRTYWRRHGEKKDDIEPEEEPVNWWDEQRVGYVVKGNDEPVFQWSEEFLRSREDVDGTNDKENNGEEHEGGGERE